MKNVTKTANLFNWALIAIFSIFIFPNLYSNSNIGLNPDLDTNKDRLTLDPPTALCQDITISLDVSGIASITATMVDNGSFDNSTPVTLSIDNDNFNCSNIGYNNVLLTVTDDNGDSANCTSIIAVIASSICPVPAIANMGGSIIPAPCTCTGNGDFGEEIIISTLANQEWTILSTTLIDENTDLPYPNGTILMDAAGIYSIPGYHLDGQGYNFQAESLFYPGLTLFYANLCHYPNPIFDNLDPIYCLSSPSFDLSVMGIENIDGTGTFTINSNPVSSFDAATLGIGMHLIEYSFDAGDPAGQLNPLDVGCTTQISMTVEVTATPSPVCQSPVMVAADESCSRLVLPADVLMGNYDCFDDYIVLIINNSDILGNIIPADFLDINLSFLVRNIISNAECSGIITLKDLTAPTLDCKNKTINCAASFLPDVADNCDSNPILSLDNEMVLDAGICDNDTTIIERTWIATDEAGNVSLPCLDTITVYRLNPNDIDFPDDQNFSCVVYAADQSIIDPENAGSPNVPTGGYCQYEVASSDIIIAGDCENFQIQRTWTITDWCTGSIITTNTVGEDNLQIIAVEDVTAPQITVSPYVVAVDAPSIPNSECTSIAFIAPPLVDDNCNNFTIRMLTDIGELDYINGVDGAEGGKIPSPGLPIGVHSLGIQVEDDCGNINQIQTTITVQDNILPMAMCPLQAFVELDENGEKKVDAEFFNDGSTDNCCISSFEIKRVSDNNDIGNCTGNPINSFSDILQVCCEDISQNPIEATLRVYDCFGNFNDCTVQIIIQDLSNPVLLFCPTNQFILSDIYKSDFKTTLDAGDYSILDQFGQTSFSDNCTLSTNSNTDVIIDACGEGSIIRTWTAADESGNSAPTCTQLILVRQVSDWVVEFPANQTLNCSQIGNDFGEPEIFFETCEMITISFEDEMANGANDICFEINRTWAAVNWCVVGFIDNQEVTEIPESQFAPPFNDLNGDGDSNDRTFRDSWNGSSFPGIAEAGLDGPPDTDPDNNPWDGYIEYTQTIEIQDFSAPAFPSGCEAMVICLDEDWCETTVPIPIIPVEDCSGVFNVLVTSGLGTGLGPFPNTPIGDYQVIYTATDICGNVSTCETTLSLQDCQNPIANCISNLSLNIENEQNPQITLNVSQLDGGSADFCTENLILSFLENEIDTTLNFACDSLGAVFPVQLWVTDEGGNQASCQTIITITDDSDYCNSDLLTLTGNISTEGGLGVALAEVFIGGSGNNSSYTTDETGDYLFSDINQGDDLTITAQKNINYENGLTTFDLVLITKHVLNQELLDSPYKIIAADANGSNSVTTFDLVTFRRVILFIEPNFGDVPSWRFIDADHEFADPMNPFFPIFPELININNINENLSNIDFIGVKIGDVNDSVNPLNIAASDDRNFEKELIFSTKDQYLETNKSYQIPFYLTDFQHIGFQFTLNFDKEFLNLEKIESDYLTADNFGLNLTSEGAITASWHDLEPAKLKEDEPIFTIHFESLSEAFLENLISINSRFTKTEAYNVNENIEGIALAFSVMEKDEFQLISNYPNPFHQETAIQFFLPENGILHLSISDISGKVLLSQHQSFEGGNGIFLIDKKQLNGKGIYFYQIDYQGNQFSGRMVLE